MFKSQLRKIYLEKQRALSPVERGELSKKIADNFFANVSLKNVSTLHIFLSIEKNNEIDTYYIYQRIWHEHPQIKTIVPKVNFNTDELESVEFKSGTELQINKWGIPEPKTVKVVGAREIDMIVVPLLCFDEIGYRVGYGKGFYDKLISVCRMDVQKVGLSYFGAEEEISDVNSFDQKMDVCVTPEEVLLLN